MPEWDRRQFIEFEPHSLPYTLVTPDLESVYHADLPRGWVG